MSSPAAARISTAARAAPDDGPTRLSPPSKAADAAIALQEMKAKNGGPRPAVSIVAFLFKTGKVLAYSVMRSSTTQFVPPVRRTNGPPLIDR